MLENFYKYAGLQFARFQFRNDVDTVQMMTEFMSTAKHALIALPQRYEEAMIASDAIRSTREKFKQVHVTVINTGTRVTSLVDFPKHEVIRLEQIDLNRFFLPTKALLRRLLQKEYDVAIDLNLDFVLHTAYICKASRARVRVGFAHHPYAELFFNVLFNVNTERTPKTVFEKFAACLSMF
jgi:ADP-heptose:LPS heptosyltransferase